MNPNRPILPTLALALAALVFSVSAHAGLVNDVPSCYAATHIQPQGKLYNKLVYIVLDQTVRLYPSLKQSVVNNALRMLVPGSKFVIADFSAYSQGRYLSVLHSGIIEPPLAASRINSTPIHAASALRRCLSLQHQFAVRMVATTLKDVMNASSSSLDRSDIMLAMKVVSAAVAADAARYKTVFVVTDGLENSSITSFYAKDGVRDIRPRLEMTKAAAAHMFGNFGGAWIYVLGSALMPPATHGTRAQLDGYRNPRTLLSLKRFWRDYFSRSDACLREFGEPALVEPVSYVRSRCRAEGAQTGKGTG